MPRASTRRVPDSRIERAREALGTFLAAALHSTAPEELAAMPGAEAVSIELPAAAVRRALLVYEEELAGSEVSSWIERGRIDREAAGSAIDHAPMSRYQLEVVDAGTGVPTVYGCRDLEEVRECISAAALGAVDAVESALGLEARPEAARDLAATLGRQAYRRMAAELLEAPGAEASFELPDRPWLRLAGTVAPLSAGRA